MSRGLTYCICQHFGRFINVEVSDDFLCLMSDQNYSGTMSPGLNLGSKSNFQCTLANASNFYLLIACYHFLSLPLAMGNSHRHGQLHHLKLHIAIRRGGQNEYLHVSQNRSEAKKFKIEFIAIVFWGWYYPIRTSLVGAWHRTADHTWWGTRKPRKHTDSFFPDTRSFKSRHRWSSGIKPVLVLLQWIFTGAGVDSSTHRLRDS